MKTFKKQIDEILQLSKRILVVEHDLTKRNELVSFLKQQNHEVIIAKDGLSASEMINYQTFDLFIIDKYLPYNDAFTLYHSIKNKSLNTPVILITNHEEECEIVSIAYENFKKNFVCTLKKIIENSLKKEEEEQERQYKIGAFTLDPKLRILHYKNEHSIRLTKKESKLLKILISYNYRLVHKNVLKEKVWYNDDNVSNKTMNVYVSRLRKILKNDKNISIKNVYKKGFILTD